MRSRTTPARDMPIVRAGGPDCKKRRQRSTSRPGWSGPLLFPVRHPVRCTETGLGDSLADFRPVSPHKHQRERDIPAADPGTPSAPGWFCDCCGQSIAGIAGPRARGFSGNPMMRGPRNSFESLTLQDEAKECSTTLEHEGSYSKLSFKYDWGSAWGACHLSLC